MGPPPWVQIPVAVRSMSSTLGASPCHQVCAPGLREPKGARVCGKLLVGALMTRLTVDQIYGYTIHGKSSLKWFTFIPRSCRDGGSRGMALGRHRGLAPRRSVAVGARCATVLAAVRKREHGPVI
jgi:hypothetical protein